jgi:drug/metabolite transporter (DMT)-like permease
MTKSMLTKKARKIRRRRNILAIIGVLIGGFGFLLILASGSSNSSFTEILHNSLIGIVMFLFAVLCGLFLDWTGRK